MTSRKDDEDGSVGHLCKVVKTAASAIFKTDDVIEDIGDLERVDKTIATKSEDVT